MDSEGFSHDGWEHTKEKTVTKTTETGYKAEEIRVNNVEGAKLGDGKDAGGDDKAPNTTGVYDFDEEVRTNTTEESTCKASK